MIKFACEYTDGKLPSVYTGDITDIITMRFKKANHTVM
jgi:hypothetical protein